MHICDHHRKVYFNIEKRFIGGIETHIGGQKFIGGTEMDQYRYHFHSTLTWSNGGKPVAISYQDLLQSNNVTPSIW